jgi:hypothetical protein
LKTVGTTASSNPLSASEMALIDATLALTAHLDTRQTCAAMLDAAERVFAARSSWILLHDAASNELVTCEFRGPGAAAHDAACIPSIAASSASRSAAARRYSSPVDTEDRWYDRERVKDRVAIGVYGAAGLRGSSDRDLDVLMRSGQFGRDLFYRLSVFPVLLPLRERPTTFPPSSVTSFAGMPTASTRHRRASAPGSSSGSSLLRPPEMTPESRADTDNAADASRVSNVIRFSDAERHAIRRALQLAGWRISRPGGAAEILGVKPTTLHAKMKKLGIRRPGGEP